MENTKNKATVEWTVPKSLPGDAEIRLNGRKELVGFMASDAAEVAAFMRELDRQTKMLAILYRASRKFEDGSVDYKNAAENLGQLTREIDKIEISAMRHARTFWKFTAIADDKNAQISFERMFEPRGDLFLQFVIDCLDAFIEMGADIKNSPRARTGS